MKRQGPCRLPRISQLCRINSPSLGISQLFLDLHLMALHLCLYYEIVEVFSWEVACIFEKLTLTHRLHNLIHQLPPHPQKTRPRQRMLPISHMTRLILKTRRFEHFQYDLSIPPLIHTRKTVRIYRDGQCTRLFEDLVG